MYHHKLQYHLSHLLIFLFWIGTSYTAFCQEVHFTKAYSIQDGLGQRSQQRIIRDDLGQIWLFSDVAFQLYTGDEFIDVPLSLPIDFDSIRTIELLENDRIALTARDRIYSLDVLQKKVKILETPDSLNSIVFDSVIVSQNFVDNKLGMLDPLDDWIKLRYVEESFVGLSGDSILRIKHSTNGVLLEESKVSWLDCTETECLYIKGDSLYSYNLVSQKATFKQKAKYALLRQDRTGAYMLAMSDNPRRFFSFYLVDDGLWTDFSVISEHTNTIRDFYADDFTEAILLATYNGLIYHNMGKGIQTLLGSDKKEGRFGNVIWWTIHRKRNKSIYFAKETEGLFEYNGNTIIKHFPSKQYPDVFKANSFGAYDESRDLVFGFSKGKKENKLWSWNFSDEPHTIKTKMKVCTLILYDKDHLLVIGGIDKKAALALLHTPTMKITKYDTYPELGAKFYKATSVENELVLSSNLGLFRLTHQGNCELTYCVKDTLLNLPLLDHISIGDTHIAGTYGYGLYILKSGENPQQIGVKDGLADNTIASVGKDSLSQIWVSTLKGISVLDSNYNIVNNIRTEDGLSTNELNMHSFAADDQSVYIGSINGLQKIDCAAANKASFESTIPIELSYQKDGFLLSQSYDLGHDAQTPFGIDSVNIRLRNYDLYHSYLDRDYLYDCSVSQENHQLIPFNKTLSLNIKDGTEIGLSNTNWKNVELKIHSETWMEKYGLISALLALIVVLLSLLYRSKVDRLQAEKQKEVQDMQNRLDSIRASALRAQMNPHFIFNALGSIQYYIQREETELAEEYLADFAILMRRTLESSRQDYVRLKDELEMLELYVKLEHIRFEQKFDYRFEIDDDIDFTYEVPSMIIQPFIENAINHGIYHLSDKKGFLLIKMSEHEDGSLHCIIDDNGVGREYARLHTKKKHKSAAMKIVNERMQMLNHSNSAPSAVSIQDKYDSDQKSLGTLVTIRFDE